MKRLRIGATYIVFFALVIESGYLYSIRWDYVSWGSSRRDGLFFLSFYIITIPLLVAVAILKRSFFRNSEKPFMKVSFFAYALAVGLPSIDTSGSQISLGLGVIICIGISICVLLEFVAQSKLNTRRQIE